MRRVLPTVAALAVLLAVLSVGCATGPKLAATPEAQALLDLGDSLKSVKLAADTTGTTYKARCGPAAVTPAALAPLTPKECNGWVDFAGRVDADYAKANTLWKQARVSGSTADRLQAEALVTGLKKDLKPYQDRLTQAK